MSTRLDHSCFVHVPRTGGLWFHEVVRQLGLRHQILKGDVDSHFAFREMPPSWQLLTPFSFVRHPLAWIKSRWSHCIEHRLKEDYRHFRVHREFDKLVQPTFKATVKELLRWRLDHPRGIVGHTYRTMLDGVKRLARTEDMPDAAWQILHEWEGVPEDGLWTVRAVEPTNGTSGMEKYKEELESLPEQLVEQFLVSEEEAIAIWNGAGK